jgi:hypothetical protein
MRYVIFALPVVAALIAFAVVTSDTTTPSVATTLTSNPTNAVPQGPTLSPITYVKPNAYDWDKDGCSDLILRTTSGHLTLFLGHCLPNTPTQFEQASFDMGLPGWDNADMMLLPGDFDHDGCADLIARIRADTSKLILFSGDCAHSFKGTKPLTNINASPYLWFVGVGSWDGDGCMDLLALQEDGALLLFPGNCNGDVSGIAYVLPGDFSGYDWFNGPGHWDYELGFFDFCGDLIARRADDQTLWFFDGDCEKGFGFPAEKLGEGWGGFDFIESGGDWNSEDPHHCPDIMGRRIDNAQLRFYFSDCVGGFTEGDVHESDRALSPEFFDYVLGDAGKIVLPASPFPKGDVTCDNTVSVADAKAELQFLAHVDFDIPLGCFPLVDMNCDVSLTVLDPFMILRALVGLPMLIQGCPPVAFAT